VSCLRVAGQSMGSVCHQRELLLALGTLSPLQFADRRMAQRLTWMRSPEVGQSGEAPICSVFVVRSGGAPPWAAAALERENRAFADVLPALTIAWNESRVRGPMLCLSWWLRYAATHLRHARFVGKADDDTYLHVPGVAALLRQVDSELGSGLVYLGVLTYYHWSAAREASCDMRTDARPTPFSPPPHRALAALRYPRIFETTRHAWTFNEAVRAGTWCRNNDLVQPGHIEGCGAGGCGRCVGPFPFASGFLIVVSRALADALVAGGGLDAEERAISAIRPERLPDRHGRFGREMAMEDVWLGSVLHRYPPARRVHYVSLVGGRGARLVVDAWDFRLSRSAILLHLFTKQPERYFAMAEVMQRPGMHCALPLVLSCSPFAQRTRPGAPLVPHGSWCKVGARDAAGADARRRHALATPGAEPVNTASCCSEIGNRSCTAIFGSNRWAAPYLPATRKLKCATLAKQPRAGSAQDLLKCFEDVARSIQSVSRFELTR
jgi:hypothetical protein